MELYYVWGALYLSVFFALLFGINHFRLSVPNVREADQTIQSFAVIVPFRNEAEKLSSFIDCIKKQQTQPVCWYFINDHSTDDFSRCFEGLEAFPIRLMHLPKQLNGKKQAIRFALEHMDTEYCLTMDADVVFHANYMTSLAKLTPSPLIILPVEMKAKKWWQSLFSVEYAFTTLINKAVTGWKRPILCSGANLLFHRETFLKIDDFEKHQDQASGDDIYTLRAFRENKLTVQLHESEVLTVVTDVPNTLIEAMHQRIRWAGKSANVADSLSNAIALLSVLMHLGFALLAFVSLLAGAFGLLLTLFGFKLVLDSMLMMSDQKKWNVQTFFNLLFFELAYPFYLVSLLPLLLFLQPEWKGR